MVDFLGFLGNSIDAVLRIEIVPNVSGYTLALIGLIGAAIAIVVSAATD